MYRYIRLSQRFRLLDVDAFPEGLRASVRAATEAIIAEGHSPADYAASVSTRIGEVRYDGMYTVYARNDACDAWPNARGCPCQWCREFICDPFTGEVIRVFWVR